MGNFIQVGDILQNYPVNLDYVECVKKYSYNNNNSITFHLNSGNNLEWSFTGEKELRDKTWQNILDKINPIDINEQVTL